MSNNSSSNFKVASIVLAVLFVVTGAYTVVLYNQSKDREAELISEKQAVIDDLSAMSEKYDTAIAENEAVNLKLSDAKVRIEELVAELKKSKASVKVLWKYKSKYLSLKKEMKLLLAENDSLKVANTELAATLDNTRVELEESNAYSETLLNQNNELTDKVEDASVFSAGGLKAFAVKVKSSGKIIDTKKAKRVDKIKVCYTVVKNRLLEDGENELFVQVIDPKNNVLGANEQVSFDDGKVLNYSAVSTFNYRGENIDLCEFIGPGENEFEKGNYTVNVFNKKEIVCSSGFSLK